MSNYKEIVTKAVISKGKRLFSTNYSVKANNPSTILGCWVINHNFNGTKSNNKIVITGSYDVNIWYSYDNDTKTAVVRETNTYSETINMRRVSNMDEEVIVRSLQQPSCVKAEIDGNKITYTIEKVLGVELVGDVKVKVETNDEDPWDEIGEDEVEEVNDVKSVATDLDNKIDENFIKEDTI